MMNPGYTKTVGHYFKYKVIESHLDGKYALCVFSGPKITRFLCVDIDEGGKKAVRQVVDAFVELGIPKNQIYISISGRKGYHVDIFFNPWLYNEKAKNLYDLMIWKTGLNPKKVEYMPRPTHAVKIPLGIHAKTGRRCWFLDQDTLEPIEDMDYVETILPIDNDIVLGIIRDNNKKRWNELYAEMICEDRRDNSINYQKELNFDDDYWESKRVEQRGTRHGIMTQIACDFRHYGANRYQIEKALTGFYYRQDMGLMDTSENEVLDDINEISKWAEESVPVWSYRPSPSEVEPRTAVFDKTDINYILNAPTSAARKVAFLLWFYCKLFNSAHISYWTIAETTGCSVTTVKTAVNKLVEQRSIFVQSGGCHYSNGQLVRRSNTYFIPKNKLLACPDESDLVADSFEISEKLCKENFASYYYKTLGAICTPEYLAKFLTKPELEEIKNEN